LWRITDDFWDNWRLLYPEFERLNSWTPFRAPGHWPDSDMLPLCNIRAWQTQGNGTHFTKDEQYTMMTLWCIARSPLIMGGNMTKNDDFTLSLMTNDEVLAVDQESTNNRQLFNTNNMVAWVADVPDSKDKYLALFNASPAPVGGRGRVEAPTPAADTASAQPREISVSLAELGFSASVKVRDLWNHKNLGSVTGTFTQTINSHGAGLYRIHPKK